MKEPGAAVFLSPIQDLRGGGRQSDASTQFTLRGDDLNELRTWAERLNVALRDVPELADVNSDQENRGLQMTLVIDRATASRLGVSTRAIDATLGLAFGQSYCGVTCNRWQSFRRINNGSRPTLAFP